MANETVAKNALDEAEMTADHAEAIAEVLAHFNAGNEEDAAVMRRVAWDLFRKIERIREHLAIARVTLQ